MHEEDDVGFCDSCGQAWPCDYYKLRELVREHGRAVASGDNDTCARTDLEMAQMVFEEGEFTQMVLEGIFAWMERGPA